MTRPMRIPRLSSLCAYSRRYIAPTSQARIQQVSLPSDTRATRLASGPAAASVHPGRSSRTDLKMRRWTDRPERKRVDVHRSPRRRSQSSTSVRSPAVPTATCGSVSAEPLVGTGGDAGVIRLARRDIDVLPRSQLLSPGGAITASARRRSLVYGQLNSFVFALRRRGARSIRCVSSFGFLTRLDRGGDGCVVPHGQNLVKIAQAEDDRLPSIRR